MPVNPADSPILGTLYGSDAMRAVFDETAYFQRMLDVEAALARVQAQLGIIPAEAAEAIVGRREGGEPEHRGARRQRPQRRLSGRRPRRRTVQGSRRGRRLDPLGRDDAGHHGHRDRAAGARGADPDRGRAARDPERADRPGAAAPHHGDGRAHPSAAGAAGHLRPEMRDLGHAVPGASGPAEAAPHAGRAGRVRRRRRHAGLAWRSGDRGHGRRWPRSWAWRRRSHPGMSAATRWPRRSRSSVWSAARWRRSPPTSSCWRRPRWARSPNPMSPGAASPRPCRRSAIRSRRNTFSRRRARCRGWCR